MNDWPAPAATVAVPKSSTLPLSVPPPAFVTVAPAGMVTRRVVTADASGPLLPNCTV